MYEELSDIPAYPSWTAIKAVTKGYSSEKKFYIEDSDGQRFLLRLAGADQFDAKQTEFELMKKIARRHVSMSIPLDFGKCQAGVYSLFTWIDGISLEEKLPSLTPKQKYQFGLQAGKILRQTHQQPAASGILGWRLNFEKNWQHWLNRYQESSIHLTGADKAIDYVKAGLSSLDDCPQTFLHGDFHRGNFIVDPDSKLSVIDFNRWDYGDPFQDLKPNFWFNRELSTDLARGQIDGYFQDGVPETFWQRIAIYLACETIVGPTWAIPYGENEVADMKKRAAMIFDDFDNFERKIPKWYKS